jgi:hypothetical protein
MIKISPLIGNLFAVRRFLTYKEFEAEKESMDKFAPSERNTTVNSKSIFNNDPDESNSNPM